jgi:Family of unknown function (DUF5681)
MEADDSTSGTDRTGRYPNRYKPGQCGNPNGRPRLSPEERAKRLEQKRLARQIVLRELDVVMLTREHAETAAAVLGKIIRSTKADDLTKLKAISELLDRAFGKPTETSTTLNLNANVMTPEAHAAGAAALQRLLALTRQGSESASVHPQVSVPDSNLLIHNETTDVV